MACQITSNHPLILQSSVPPFFGAAFGFSQRLTAGPRPPKLSRFKLSHPLFSVLFSMLLFDSNLLRFSAQHDPILDPKLAPINPSFALLFPITFPTRFPTSFWTNFGPKSTSKSIKNQSEISSKIKLQTSPISASSSIKFRRQSHVQAKWSMFKNRSKTNCFQLLSAAVR